MTSPLTPLTPSNDSLNPKHYKPEPSADERRDRRSISKMEVIDVIEKFDLNFARGNAVKYVLRAGKKGSNVDTRFELEDLRKARQYLNREIKRLEGGHGW